MRNREQRDALSAQSACNCGARPGRMHSPDCQYIADLHADNEERVREEAALVVRDAEIEARLAARRDGK